MAASASVRAATVRDSSEVGRLIGVAFADDPVARWALGAPPQIEQTFRFLASHLYVPARSSALIDGCGAAMWFAPGQYRAPTLLEQVMIAGKLAAGDAGFRHIRRTIQVDKATTSRRPEGCYYLFAIGVLPEARHRGLATTILKHTLALADRDGVSAYLENSNPDNAPLYERLGFVATDAFEPAPGCPPLVPMTRLPRT